MTKINNSVKPRMTHLDERKILQVPYHKYEERYDLCKNCFAYRQDDQICDIGGSPVQILAKQKSAICPLGFWSSYYGS